MIKTKKTRKIKKWKKNYPKFIPRVFASPKIAFHKIHTREIQPAVALSVMDVFLDIGNYLMNSADYVSLGNVYKRFKVIGLKVSIINVFSNSNVACLPYYVGYNPNTLSNPGGAISVLDLDVNRQLSFFRTDTPTLFCKPKLCSNTGVNPNSPACDEDGFLNFQVTQPPFYGSIQMYGAACPSAAVSPLTVVFTYYVICTYEG